MKCTTVSSVAVLAVQALLASDGSQFAIFHFTARVESVELVIDPHDPYGHRSRSYSEDEIAAAHGRILFVGFEARWHILMTIAEAPLERGFIPVGSTVTFVVRSPAQTLLGTAEDSKGREYQFQLVGRPDDDKRTSFIDLRRVVDKGRANQRVERNAGYAHRSSIAALALAALPRRGSP